MSTTSSRKILSVQKKLINALEHQDAYHKMKQVFRKYRNIATEDDLLFFRINSNTETMFFERALSLSKLDDLYYALKENDLIKIVHTDITLKKDDQYNQHYVNFVANVINDQTDNRYKILFKEIRFLVKMIDTFQNNHLETSTLETTIAKAFLQQNKNGKELLTRAIPYLNEYRFHQLIHFYHYFFYNFSNSISRDELISTNKDSLFQWLVEHCFIYHKNEGFDDVNAQKATCKLIYNDDFKTFCSKTPEFKKHLIIYHELINGDFDHNYDFDVEERLQIIKQKYPDVVVPEEQQPDPNKWTIDYFYNQQIILITKSDNGFFKIKVDDPFMNVEVERDNVLIKLPSYDRSFRLKKGLFQAGALNTLCKTLVDWQYKSEYNSTQSNSLTIDETS